MEIRDQITNLEFAVVEAQKKHNLILNEEKPASVKTSRQTVTEALKHLEDKRRELGMNSGMY